MSSKEVNVGSTCRVRVGDSYETTLTADVMGTMRFPENKLYRWLADKGVLNDMAIAYHEKKFSKEEYLDFYLNIRYSLDGFCDLSMFSDCEVTPIDHPKNNMQYIDKPADPEPTADIRSAPAKSTRNFAVDI